MAERRVAEVVGQGDRFGQVLVEPQGPRDRPGDLGNFQRMGQPGPEVVLDRRDKDLGLMFQAAESFAVEDLVPVALEGGAEVVFLLRQFAAPGL
jgi:hypothetical protein